MLAVRTRLDLPREGTEDSIHSQLGTLEDFRRLVAAARDNGLEIALDFAIQCSPDHPWLQDHPEWFNRRPDGSIKYAENPPKKYEDIVNVDFYGRNSGDSGRRCVTSCFFGHVKGSASLGSTTRTPSHCRSGSG